MWETFNMNKYFVDKIPQYNYILNYWEIPWYNYSLNMETFNMNEHFIGKIL